MWFRAHKHIVSHWGSPSAAGVDPDTAGVDPGTARPTAIGPSGAADVHYGGRVDSSSFVEAIGASAQMSFEVTQSDTAAAVGSGTVAVLGTPVVVAWLEAATLQVVEMPAGGLSLGVHIDVAHVAASAVGETITAQATLREVDGLRMTFAVEARNEAGAQVAHGTIARVAVDRERFLGRLQRPTS